MTLHNFSDEVERSRIEVIMVTKYSDENSKRMYLLALFRLTMARKKLARQLHAVVFVLLVPVARKESTCKFKHLWFIATRIVTGLTRIGIVFVKFRNRTATSRTRIGNFLPNVATWWQEWQQAALELAYFFQTSQHKGNMPHLNWHRVPKHRNIVERRRSNVTLFLSIWTRTETSCTIAQASNPPGALRLFMHLSCHPHRHCCRYYVTLCQSNAHRTLPLHFIHRPLTLNNRTNHSALHLPYHPHRHCCLYYVTFFPANAHRTLLLQCTLHAPSQQASRISRTAHTTWNPPYTPLVMLPNARSVITPLLAVQNKAKTTKSPHLVTSIDLQPASDAL